MNQMEFLKNLQADNNDNHRVLLWKALECTKGEVVEWGAGWGSTEYLRSYCKIFEREPWRMPSDPRLMVAECFGVFNPLPAASTPTKETSGF